jgi:hypothetical protein
MKLGLNALASSTHSIPYTPADSVIDYFINPSL